MKMQKSTADSVLTTKSKLLNIAPAVSVRSTMHPEATNEERLIGFEQLRQNRTTFLQSAADFLTPDQTTNFEEMYTQSNQWIDQWINRLQNPGQPSRGK